MDEISKDVEIRIYEKLLNRGLPFKNEVISIYLGEEYPLLSEEKVGDYFSPSSGVEIYELINHPDRYIKNRLGFKEHLPSTLKSLLLARTRCQSILKNGNQCSHDPSSVGHLTYWSKFSDKEILEMIPVKLLCKSHGGIE